MAEVYYALEESRTRSLTMAEDVVPAARVTFEAMEMGLESGVEGLEDLFDARRDLTRAEIDHLEALVGFHRSLAELERLLGRGLDELD